MTLLHNHGRWLWVPAFAGTTAKSPAPSPRRLALFSFRKRRKRICVIGMPARQRGAVFDDVAGGPQDAPFVEAARHVVVRAQDVEIASLQPLDHEINRLLRRPRAGRLFGAAPRGEAGEDVAGDQQMRADPAAVGVAQLMLQRLGKCLYAGLGGVVGGFARRRGDALLGSGIDDEA